MIGSSYPDANDGLTVPAQTPWCSVLINELISMMLSVQRTIGANVGNLDGIGAPTYIGWNAAFLRRSEIEIGTFTTHATAYSEKTISFSDPNKFTNVPRVFLIEDESNVWNSKITAISASDFKVKAPFTSTTVTYIAVGGDWDD